MSNFHHTSHQVTALSQQQQMVPTTGIIYQNMEWSFGQRARIKDLLWSNCIHCLISLDFKWTIIILYNYIMRKGFRKSVQNLYTPPISYYRKFGKKISPLSFWALNSVPWYTWAQLILITQTDFLTYHIL